MTSLYQLKPGFQNLLRPVCRGLTRARVSPNAVTIAGVLLSVAMGWLVLTLVNPRILLPWYPAVLLLRMALNALDGMLAQALDRRTRFGSILNEAADIVSDVALYLPLAVVPGFAPVPLIVVVALALACEVPGLFAAMTLREARREGPMGKSDRAFALGLLAVLVWLGALSVSGVAVYLSGVAIFIVVTAVNRATAARGATR
ncbi:MAG: CDP-alcohol phosphatidyltransferase family protein [Lentisphaerae bacterium]|nr:CDP-alcohol phosphatidyltransferase family protein [Lentisphaerota bacterium]